MRIMKSKLTTASAAALLMSYCILQNECVEASTINNVSYIIDPAGPIFSQNANDLTINSGSNNYSGNDLANTAGTFTVNGGEFNFFQDRIAFECGDVIINGGSFTLNESRLGENCKSLYISPSATFTLLSGFIGVGCENVVLENAIINHGASANSLVQSGPISIKSSVINNLNNSCFITSVLGSVSITDSVIVNGTGCNALNMGYTWGQIPVTISNSTITNYELFGRTPGEVVINNCYLDNGYGKELFLRPGKMIISGSSTIINTGRFAREGAGMVITGASISNTVNVLSGSTYQAEFGIGMCKQGALNPADQGEIILGDNSYFYNSGRLAAGNGVLTLTGVNLINDTGQVALGMTRFNIGAGSITNKGEMGRGCQEVNLTGGTIYNLGPFASMSSELSVSGTAFVYNDDLGTFAWNTFPYLYISGGTIVNSGLIGPCAVQMKAGQLINDGEFFCGQTTHSVSSGPFYSSLNQYTTANNYLLSGVYSPYNSAPQNAKTSYITGGSLTGSGQLFLTGTTFINTPIEQGTVTVGYLYSPQGNSAGTLLFNNEIKADLVLTSLGKCYGVGTVVGDVYLEAGGNLTPGGLLDPSFSLNVVGSVKPKANSIINIDFDASGSDAVLISQGDLTIEQGAILRLTAKGSFPTPNREVLFAINNNSVTESVRLGGISGQFIVQGDQPLVNLDLRYTPNAIILNANYNSFTVIAQNPNQVAIGRALDQLDLNTNACLQSKIEQMYLLTDPILKDIFFTLDPAEFKGQQLVMEEVLFAANDSITKELFKHKIKYKSSVAGAYRYLNENSYSQYDGFHANTGYEYLTTSYGWENTQILGAVGGIQTATRYKRKPAFSSSNSIFTALGLAGFHKNFSFGVDVLFAYNFIHTHRKIDYFDLKANSNHGGYSAKLSAGLKYTKNYAETALTPYDFFSYQTSKENNFQELDDDCLGMKFISHNRQVLRNALGVNIEFLQKKKFSPYLDLAWVYEHRFGGDWYDCKFEDTNTWFAIQGLNPSSNFFRYELGVVSQLEKWDFRINLNGMYSEKLQEYEAFFNFIRKF